MVGFLCLFFPPVIAVALTTKLRKENFRYEQYIAFFAIFTVIINGIMFWILSFLFNPHWISAPDVFSTSFSAKYLLLSSILAIISAFVMGNLNKLKSLSADLLKDEETEENEEEEEEDV